MPAVLLNGVILREELSPVLITTAICSKLASKPQICREVVQNLKWQDNQVTMARLGATELVILCLVVLLLLGAVYLLIKFSSQQQLRSAIKKSID